MGSADQQPNIPCPSPIGRRVNAAIAERDLDTLRALSAAPGGFGLDAEVRARAWHFLLHLPPPLSLHVRPTLEADDVDIPPVAGFSIASLPHESQSPDGTEDELGEAAFKRNRKTEQVSDALADVDKETQCEEPQMPNERPTYSRSSSKHDQLRRSLDDDPTTYATILPPSLARLPPHRDEAQVKLDVDRSFFGVGREEETEEEGLEEEAEDGDTAACSGTASSISDSRSVSKEEEGGDARGSPSSSSNLSSPSPHPAGVRQARRRSSEKRKQKAEEERAVRREQLYAIIVGVLRRRSALSYFQGYHDIVSVLLLALYPYTSLPPSSSSPPSPADPHPTFLATPAANGQIHFDPSHHRLHRRQEALARVLPAAERLSLHFVRDSMGAGLDPVLGQLKLVRNVLRLADPDLASLVELSSPLPYFALSWVLTLLSHDLPSSPSPCASAPPSCASSPSNATWTQNQRKEASREGVEASSAAEGKTSPPRVVERLFDFFLAWGPASVLYFCVALILAKKRELDVLDRDGSDDAALLHNALGKMPRIVLDYEAGAEVRGDEGQPEGSCGRGKGGGKGEEHGPEHVNEGSKDDAVGRDGRKGEDEEQREEEQSAVSALYSDPDVYPPSSPLPSSFLSTRASTLSNHDDSSAPSLPDAPFSIPLCMLFASALELRRRFPLDSEEVGGRKVMGPKSVLWGWEEIERSSLSLDEEIGGGGDRAGDGSAVERMELGTGKQGGREEAAAGDCRGVSRLSAIDWSELDASAERTVGETFSMVLDPYPTPPPSPPPPLDDDEEEPEKARRVRDKRKKRSRAASSSRDESIDRAARVVRWTAIVVGVASVGMALYAHSYASNGAGGGGDASAGFGTEAARRAWKVLGAWAGVGAAMTRMTDVAG